jgi:hypothetical protein
LEIWIFANEIQHAETGHARHFQIEQEQIGPGVLGSIGESSLAAEVVKHVGAVARFLERCAHASLVKGAPQEKLRILIIICRQNYWAAILG